MNNSDLAEIRAQLRAAAEDRRPPPRGPLGALRGLLGGNPRPPLLGAPMPYASPPAPRPAMDDEGDDEATLLLDVPFDLPARRHAFGQRPEPGQDAAGEPAVRRTLTALQPVADGDMVEAIRRRRSPLLRRIDEAVETPFLPEDLADGADGDIERIYSDAGLAPAQAAPQSPAPDSPLQRLERRLLEEHMLLIRAMARRGP
jgi:hypothetical protein